MVDVDGSQSRGRGHQLGARADEQRVEVLVGLVQGLQSPQLQRVFVGERDVAQTLRLQGPDFGLDFQLRRVVAVLDVYELDGENVSHGQDPFR